jgi:hypothetical protein
MNTAKTHGWSSQWIVAAVFAAMGLGLLAFFVRFAEPPEREHYESFKEDYSEAPLETAITAESFDRHLAEIARASAPDGTREVGRLTGSSGFLRTEQLIMDSFRAAGLETRTQEFRVVVPVTEYCEVLDETGKPLPGVTLYPFQPCGLTPTVLPEGGMTGVLLVAESTDLKYLKGHEPEDTILLTYLDTGGDWPSLESKGIKAVVVMEDEAAKKLRASPDDCGPWYAMTHESEVAYPRFLARGPLADYAGRRLVFRCKVTWQERKVRNLMGVLRGTQPTQEALVLTTFYDSNSQVPELAPGAEPAVSLAVFLQYLEALAQYRGELKRDVIFVATAGHAQALAGAARLMEVIGRYRGEDVDPSSEYAKARADEEVKLDYATRGLAMLDDDGWWESPETSGFHDRWLKEAPDYRKWLEKCFATAAGEICLDRKEETLTHRLTYLRAGRPVFRDGFNAAAATDAERRNPANTHPLLQSFLKAQEAENRAGNIVTLPLWQLVLRPEFKAWDFRRRTRASMTEMIAYHKQQIKELSDCIGVYEFFAPYKKTFTVNLELHSGGSRKYNGLTVQVGIPVCGSFLEPQVTALTDAIQEKIPVKMEKDQRKRIFDVIQWGAKDAAGSTETPNIHRGESVKLESEAWTLCSRLGFSVLNSQFFPSRLGSPEDVFEELTTDGVKDQILPVGKAVLSIAKGRVVFKSIPVDRKRRMVTLHGSVYGTAAAGTVFPNHPMAQNTIVRAYQRDMNSITRAVRLFPILKANPYGDYRSRLNFNFVSYGGWGRSLTLDAARYGDDGRIIYFKDASASCQSIFGNEKVSSSKVLAVNADQASPINIVLFRCHHLEMFDRSNPQTMKSFKGVSFLGQQGLAGPKGFRFDGLTAFLDPDFLFYLGLMDGASDNEQVQVYRSFMFNMDPGEAIAPDEPELYGRGYLAADVDRITYPHIDATESMLRTNEKRIRLLQRYGMTDQLIHDFHARGREWLELAKQKRAEKDPLAAVLAASKGLSYAINNHPVIRKKVAHAVVGIIWYLGLLVPFVFVFEKLVFGFTDIRKQLLAGGTIFLVVFGLLRMFHPAFEMVRSSIMILIGFIMLLLTILVMLMVGGKFKQNIRNLRSREGRVEGADINRGGVVGTAFMLGLNNMRRRKVRTGLTCVTLVLITFVMICFTSVSTDLVNVEYATARSSWNGLFICNPNFLPLSGGEISVLRQTYGRQYPVRVTSWMTATTYAESLQNSEILIDREFMVGDQKIQKRSRVSASICMEWNEPQFSGIDKLLLSRQTWFPRPPATRKARLDAAKTGYKNQATVILPDTVARDLDITVNDINTTTSNIVVSIRGSEYVVLGIMDSVLLGRQTGLDGRSILPFDLSGIQSLGRNAVGVPIVPEDTKRLPASQVILVNRHPTPVNEILTDVSCSILFPTTSYQMEPDGPTFPAVGFKEQRRLILEYLERSGTPAYYAVDGVSYFGSRARSRSFGGMLELLIPILIAALTVFNTMRGSVYERRDEIYVYNAVGIAPNHVFFMFMAEACVYAVVGAMLGYLLSQASGRVLTALHLTGGLNMNYSSIETIYASLTIVAAVLLSTILPARDAARLASPSDMKEWTIPEPVNDGMAFDLPFTFTQHERVAAISYFYRWLDANGEGSSGPFFCLPPVVCLRADAKETRSGHLLPSIQATIWLRPYDLGVSQRMEIWLPSDPETGEYVAHVRLARLSGTSASWERAVRPFLSVLRKQFLNWRAATPDEREEMFAEAKEILSKCTPEEATHG